MAIVFGKIGTRVHYLKKKEKIGYVETKIKNFLIKQKVTLREKIIIRKITIFFSICFGKKFPITVNLPAPLSLTINTVL